MPMKPPRACACPGCATCNGRCAELVRSGRCSDCLTAHRKATPRSAAGAVDKKMYDTKRWTGLRRTKLQRDPWCQADGCHSLATEVDHVVSIRDGGDPWPPLDGLNSLCKPCHSRKTMHEIRRRQTRGEA